MMEYYDVHGNDAGDASHAIEAYTMSGHMAAFGEASRFVDMPDPETEPDPEFEGLSWLEIVEWIDDYDRDRWEEENYRYMVERYGW